MQASITDIDPFDLPEWLGTHDVVWRSDAGLRTGHLVRGRLTADAAPTTSSATSWPSTRPIPEPVVDDATRLRVHQAWRHGQVVVGVTLGRRRMVLAVPGTASAPTSSWTRWDASREPSAHAPSAMRPCCGWAPRTAG